MKNRKQFFQNVRYESSFPMIMKRYGRNDDSAQEISKVGLNKRISMLSSFLFDFLISLASQNPIQGDTYLNSCKSFSTAV